MNPILMFLTQFGLTGMTGFLLVTCLRPHWVRILVDTCRTEARARFRAAFSNIVLIALPAIVGLGDQPVAVAHPAAFFVVTGPLRLNLIGFIFALIMIGLGVSFFALLAPRPKENSSRKVTS